MNRITGSLLLCCLFAACKSEPTGPDLSVDPSSFMITITNTAPTFTLRASGTFDTPDGDTTPGPLTVGDRYVITFPAAPGYPAVEGDTRFTFASMFVPSNDLFIGPGAAGIDLFDAEGNPNTGSVVDQIQVWDAGTEFDQPLNGTATESPDQKPWQGADDQGAADPNPLVRLAEVTYPLQIPAVSTLITAELEHDAATGMFSLTLVNIAGPGTLAGTGAFAGAVPLSPGVWTVFSDADGGPLFSAAAADDGMGLEALAEDGVASGLATVLATETGVNFVSSPGLWIVQNDDDILFKEGDTLPGGGMEALAEDGNSTAAITTLGGHEDVDSSGRIGDGPIAAGGSFTFEIAARPGQRLNFATMVVPSNDRIFAPDGGGISLFDEDGNPRGGDVTQSVRLWDVGTEIDQPVGVGQDQVHLQSGPNTGIPDGNNTVRPVADPDYPPGNTLIEVEIDVI